jgi:hypothetical protein
MKKKIILAGMVVLCLALLFSTGVVLAKAPPKTVGERIFLYTGGDWEFPAGQPFHIMHGFSGWYEIGEPGGPEFGLDYMIVEVDGVEQQKDYLDITWTPYPEFGLRNVLKLYIFNFPEGMTGQHEFVRRYFLTCEYINQYLTPMECDYPAQVVEYIPWKQQLTINFTD